MTKKPLNVGDKVRCYGEGNGVLVITEITADRTAAFLKKEDGSAVGWKMGHQLWRVPKARTPKGKPLAVGDHVYSRGDGADVFTIHAMRPDSSGAFLVRGLTQEGTPHGWEAVDRLSRVPPSRLPRRLLPIGKDTGSYDIYQRVIKHLTDFVGHARPRASGGVPGGHDIRAGQAATDILTDIQAFLDGKAF